MENDNNSASGSAWGNLTVTANSTADDFFWTRVIYPSGYTPLGLLITSLIVTFIMIIIVVGNVLVIIAIATEKSLKGIQNWFIASLAVADCLLGLIIMPFSLAKEIMGYWVFGQWWCDVHSAVDVLLCTSSIMNICLISLDRYWSITRAMEYLRQRTPSRVAFMITIVWILSGLISIPPLLGWKKDAEEDSETLPLCELSTDIGYVLYSALGSFYIPSCIMVFVYIRIYFAARARARRALENRMKRQSQTKRAVLVEEHAVKKVIVCTDMEHRVTNGKSHSVIADEEKASCYGQQNEENGEDTNPTLPCKSSLNTKCHLNPDDIVTLNEPCSTNVSEVSNYGQVNPMLNEEMEERLEANNGISEAQDQREHYLHDDIKSKCSSDDATRQQSTSPEWSTVVDINEKIAYVRDNRPSSEIPMVVREEALRMGRRTSLLCPTKKRFEKFARHLHHKYALNDTTQVPTSTMVTASAAHPDAEYSTSSYPSTPDNDPASPYPCPPLSPNPDSDETREKKGAVSEHSEVEPSSSNSGTITRCTVVRPLRIRFCKSTQSTAKSSKNRRQVIDTGRVGVRDKDPGRERRRLARHREKRATLILGLIMGAFILCWLPFFFLYLLNPMCPECNIQPWGFAIAFWLGYINSALNPVIYTIFNKDFRKAFRRILFRCSISRP